MVFDFDRKRLLTNTPVRQAGSVLKCADDRKNRVVSAQATYPRRSSAVGGRVCKQRYAAERVLPESRFELQHVGSPSEKGRWKGRQRPVSSAGRLVKVELAAKKSPAPQRCRVQTTNLKRFILRAEFDIEAEVTLQ